MINFRIGIFMAILFLALGCNSIFEKDIANIPVAATFTADALIEALEQDHQAYKEKAVLIKGNVVETNTKNGKYNILIKGKSNQNHYIICEMNSDNKYSNDTISKGDSVAVKGILKGYLNDAIVLNCILVNL